MFVISVQKYLVGGFKFNSKGSPYGIIVFRDADGPAVTATGYDSESFVEAANRYQAIRTGLEVSSEGVFYTWKRIEFIGKSNWVILDESKDPSKKEMIKAYRRGKNLGFFL